MGVAPWAGFLLLIGHTIQQGVLPGLLPPENVTLVSENCRTFLTWQPTANLTNSTQYEVERHNDSAWIKETACRGNNLRQTQECELYLSNLFTHYQARVRTRDGARLSGWAYSNQLQLYTDTVIGPLNLSLAAADGTLTVVISMPYGAPEEMCPHLSILKVQINLTEEGDKSQLIRKAVIPQNLKRYTFEELNPNTSYCVHVEVRDQPAKKAIQCIMMPSGKAGDYWPLLILVSVVTTGMTLLGAAGTVFVRQSLQLRLSEIDFPKSLRFQDPSGSCPAWRQILLLEESSIASLSTVLLLPDGNATMEEQALLLIPSVYRACGLSDYCANGFGQGSWSRAEDTLPVAEVEPFSSREPVRDEDLVDGSYQITQELLESPASARPPSPELHLHSRSGNSSVLDHKTGEEVRLPSPFGAAVSLNSLKLQAALGVHSPMCSPRAYVVRKDYGAQPEAQTPKATKSQVCPSQPGCPEDPAPHSDSNLETKGTETMTLSGYESRQPILSCD